MALIAECVAPEVAPIYLRCLLHLGADRNGADQSIGMVQKIFRCGVQQTAEGSADGTSETHTLERITLLAQHLVQLLL